MNKSNSRRLAPRSWVRARRRGVAIAVAVMAFAALLAFPGRAYAQNRTWAINGSTQSGTSAWSITSNWNGGGVPNAPDVTANFTNTTLTYAGLTGNTTIGNLTRSAGGASTSGTRLVITGTDTTLANQTPSSYELTFATTTGTAPTITAVGRTDVVVKIAGSQGFTKAGAGDLYLWAPNTYTGTTTISAGRVRPQAAGNLGSSADGTVVLPAGTLLLDAGALITGEPLFISGTGSGNQGSLRANGSSEYAGPITLTGSGSITANGGQTLTLSGTINPSGNYLLIGDGGNHTITGGFVGTSGTVNFGGTGVITLSGSSSFTGVTQVGNATGLVTMTGYMAGLMDFSPGGARTLVGTGTFAGGLSMGQNATLAPGASDASSDYGTLTASRLTLTNGSVVLGISDASTYDRLVMTAGSSGLTLTGATKPQLTLNFANTITSGTLDLFSFTGLTGTFVGVNSTGAYVGTWASSAGTWSLDTAGTLGSITATTTRMLFTESTGDLTFAPLPVNISGTTVTFTAGGTVANPLTVPTGSATVAANFAGLTTFSGTVAVGGAADLSAIAGGTAAFTGVISGGGTVTKSGPGTVTLNAVNTYTGNTSVAAGVLELGSGGSLSTSSAIAISSGATLQVNRSGTVTQGANFSTAAITGAGGFTQAGVGTTILTAANTYAGPTNVAAGTLLINGNQAAATGALTVAAGATLGGSGTTGGAVTINGTLSPGNSPGVFTAASVVLGASSTSFFEINTTTRGTGYDGMNITDASSLTYGGALSLSFGNGSAFANDTTFDLFNFTGTPSGNFSGVTSTGFYAGTWTLSSGTWSLTQGDQKLSFTPSTGDLVIAVPEPSTIAMLGGTVAAASLIRFVRRRRAG